MPRIQFLLALEGTGIGILIGDALAILVNKNPDYTGGLIVAVIGLICFVIGEALRR